jgi:hypothetical protein
VGWGGGRWRGLRWVDDADHAALAVPDLAAVEPDRVGVVYRHGENVGLHVSAASRRDSLVVRNTYRRSTVAVHKPAVECRCVRWLARIVKRGLHDRVVAGVELEDDFLARSDGERVRTEGEAAFADGDGLHRGGAAGRWRGGHAAAAGARGTGG